jgi:DNA primase
MAGMVTKRVLEEIRFKNDIVDVVQSSIDLKKAGGTFKALCPFHKEKTPSFVVNPQRQIFHCFGCGKGGDVFKFIMEYEGVDFIGSVKMLADRAGVKLELEDGPGNVSDKDLLLKINNDASELYQELMLNDKRAAAARNYLAGRKLNRETAAAFRIGYAPAEWHFIVEWGKAKKYSMDILERVGLIVRKTDGEGTRYYDRFRDRVMFAILDEQGRVVGFSGRIMDKEAKEAKYVNTPETPLFHKARILYGLSFARRKIVEAREAIICEGQIDVIRCHQAGFDTAVASQGTAFSEDHVRMIRRYADSVVIVFDSDDAGQSAAIRTAQIFIAAGLAVKVGALPKGDDPDSLILSKGKEAFRQVLDSAASAVAFQAQVLSLRENVRSEVGAMRVAREVLQTISNSPNAVQRERLVREAAQRLELNPSALFEELRKIMNRSSSAPSAERQQPEGAAATAPGDEKELCRHLVQSENAPEAVGLARKYLPLEFVKNPLCRDVVSVVLEASENGEDITILVREKDGSDGEMQAFVSGLIMGPNKAGIGESSSADAMRDIIMHIWRRELKEERKMLDARQEPSEAEKERRRQITYDLKAMQKWETAEPILEIEMESRRE